MDNELGNLRKRVVAFCHELNYYLATEAGKILRDIVRLKETASDYYCPCRQ
jgi:hypothetical protein